MKAPVGLVTYRQKVLEKKFYQTWTLLPSSIPIDPGLIPIDWTEMV